MDFKNVMLIGAGAVGTVYAERLCRLGSRFVIAADPARTARYRKDGILFRGQRLEAEFTTPEKGDPAADLILVAVKNYSLRDAMEVIAPAVSGNTVIVSLMNGITSESVLAGRFPDARVLYGFYIGHTSTRNGNDTCQDGNYMTVIGDAGEPSVTAEDTAGFLVSAGIHAEVRRNMVTEIWKKFTVNVCLNQTTAYFGCTYGEITGERRLLFDALADEVQAVALMEGIPGAEGFSAYGKEVLGMMDPSDRSSMAQDVLAGRRTEVEDFAGEVVRLAGMHGTDVPANLEVLRRFTLQ